MTEDNLIPSVDEIVISPNHSDAKTNEKMELTTTTQLIKNELVVKCGTLDLFFKEINLAVVQAKCQKTIGTKYSESLDSDDYSSNHDQSTLSLNSELKSETLSELMWSTDEEKFISSIIPQKWTSELNLRSDCYWELKMLTDFDKVRSASMPTLMTTTYGEQIVSSEDEGEINVNGIDVIEAENDMADILEENVAPKRKSFLSTLVRRILSAGRKLCCCGGGERKCRKRRSNGEPGK